jgi:hypothetical protein
MRGNRLRAFPNPENASLTLIQGKIRLFKRKVSFFAFRNKYEKDAFRLKTQFFPESGKRFQGFVEVPSSDQNRKILSDLSSPCRKILEYKISANLENFVKFYFLLDHRYL